jgi:phage-related protein
VDDAPLKPLHWVGSSRQDLKAFPAKVRSDVGYALYAAQRGDMDPAVKPMKGFGGASVLEIVAPFIGDTWRAIYTVRFAGAVYVLHAFQKKSKSGVATPKKEIDLIHRRLEAAERDYKERQKTK